MYCFLANKNVIRSQSESKNEVKTGPSEHNLTQADLAEKVGVTRQTIGLIENGRYNPTLYLCIAIAKALDKTLNDLFWEESKHEG